MAAHSNDLFLLGLLSVMDAILDQPLAAILAELPFRNDVKEALLERPGQYKDMLGLAIAHERADWEAISLLAPRLGLEEDQIPEIYFSAVDWASALRRGSPISGWSSALPTRENFQRQSEFKLARKKRHSKGFHQSLVTSHLFFPRAHDDHARRLFRIHRGIVDNHSVRRAHQRRHLALAVPAITLVDIGKYLIECKRLAFFLQLEQPAFRSHFGRSLQKNFEIRVREHNRADVAPLHDDSALSARAALFGNHRMPQARHRRNHRTVLRYLQRA